MFETLPDPDPYRRNLDLDPDIIPFQNVTDPQHCRPRFFERLRHKAISVQGVGGVPAAPGPSPLPSSGGQKPSLQHAHCYR